MNNVNDHNAIKHDYVAADGLKVFYRYAGNPKNPVLLLLHGFPTSSHQFRSLIPLLTARFYVVAPDLPGFGNTEVPDERAYTYSFDNLASTVDHFLGVLGIDQFALYVFDYGAPVGLRLAVRYPHRINGLVTQNGNAYLEGLSPAWEPFRAFWANPNDEVRRNIESTFLTLETIKWQYYTGVHQHEMVCPDGYLLDALFLDRPGRRKIQMDLIQDYASNLKRYPEFQVFIKNTTVPLLVIWGQNDPFFTPQGAFAFAADNPRAVVKLFPTGHFALETHAVQIAQRILEVL
jgi:pimeloyl-ACP methyl ester carboxylesterase